MEQDQKKRQQEEDVLLLKPIAYIHTDLPEKFGIPRQSGLVKELTGRIQFEPEFRSEDAVSGLEAFDYLWLIWYFQGTGRAHFNATVRPPRLGGNTRMGVFATRSPFRPNPLGLSCVKLDRIELTNEGPVLHVSGVDLRDSTPIFDIKPYIPYADAHEGARGGFADAHVDDRLQVFCDKALLEQLTGEQRSALIGILEQDPRPSYQNDAQRIYGLTFAGCNVKFRVDDAALYVVDITHEKLE